MADTPKEARAPDKPRGKTRDAFAFWDLSAALEDTIGEGIIPEFAYEPVGDDLDEESLAFGAIVHWLNVNVGEMPPYRGTARVKFLLKQTSAELKKLQFILDRLDVHIMRLRQFLLTVSKRLNNGANSKDREVLSTRRERTHFLLWRYEWIKDVLVRFEAHIEKHLESQEENLQNQFKLEFAERLRFARRKAGYTQADVAGKLKLTTAAYSNYERGLRETPIFTIYRLTEILDVSADYLFGTKKQ